MFDEDGSKLGMHVAEQSRGDAEPALERFCEAGRRRQSNLRGDGFQRNPAGQQHASRVESGGFNEAGGRFTGRRHEFAMKRPLGQAGAIRHPMVSMTRAALWRSAAGPAFAADGVRRAPSPVRTLRAP
jgi:hypothetical protein